MQRIIRIAFTCVGLLLPGSRAVAQQQSVEAHGNYARALTSKSNSWGAGANYEVTWGANSAPIRLATSLGPDYTKQAGDGPSQTSVSVDASLQPGGGGAVTPYAGGSVSENWSSGNNRQWTGAKVGVEVIAGVQVKLGANSKLSAKGEERYGYVNGQEHTMTTRLGLSASF
jgi:hypothetical protein